MTEFKIQVPNNSKFDLHTKIERIIEQYSREIKNNNVKFNRTNNVYDVYAQKNFMFVNYHVKASVEVFDNYLQVRYDTNAPDWAVKNAIDNFIIEFKKF